MKFAVAALVLASVCLANFVSAGLDGGYLYQHRKRLGQFAQQPFTDLYKDYNVAFLREPFQNTRPDDDYENYRPSASECMNFFLVFQSFDYKLDKLVDFVLLDACLGYLYDEHGQKMYREEDIKESSLVADNLDSLIANERLHKLYNGTKINEFSPEAKDCLLNLFAGFIKINKQYESEMPGHAFLYGYLKFAECHKNITVPRESDTYLDEIYKVVARTSYDAFNNEIGILNAAVHEAYKADSIEVVKNRFSLFNKQREQLEIRRWPKHVAKLLTNFQCINETTQINPREVHKYVKAVNERDWVVMRRWADKFSGKVNKALRPDKSSSRNEDKRIRSPNGGLRYDLWVDSLCQWFRRSSGDIKRDFQTPLTRMVSTLLYPEVFSMIDRDYFRKEVLVVATETVVIYLSVFACNILTHTYAVYNDDKSVAARSYKVSFKESLKNLPKWPDADYY